MQPPVRIGTRASKLAQTQTRHMQARIVAALGADPADADRVAPLVLITTTGDRIQDRRLLEAGGKALFVKEIEEALLAGEIDVAIHSMKDVPAEQPAGLTIAAIPEREDPRDAFVSLQWGSLAELPQGARLGTASLRRQAQTLADRPDLEILMLRGNVDTRLRKLAEGECDAILLAKAGLNRLGMADVVRDLRDPVAAPPAPGQGALAIQSRVVDADAAWLRSLHHAPTALAVAAERGALEALEGSCRTAVGAHARLVGDRLVMTVEGLTADGTVRWRREGSVGASASDAEARELGLDLGRQIRLEAGDRLIVA
ncbi:hydroxymethylbilane synthase [Caulobacter sp. 17J80-11]|uniref:hydroxymethylbilane synthase n=1 Tax=Caulobacter sp. 17J80-11 TaxID=2763502 RepID=UPI00165348B1|nr:hydroxymethylbilane synthase [Caulobacter sp. 17J80-11]